MLSIAFAHPIPEITAQLADGRFQSAFAGHMEVAFGEVAFGEVAFGEVAFGEVAFGEVAFGEVAFGEVAFGEVAFGEVAFGEVAFGEVAFGETAFGETAFGETAFGCIPALPLLALDPSGFASAYIALFERGTRGRPPVPLCAGEYMALLDGRPRPEVLLDHVRFYRHFGLKVRGHGEDNELPDHLCCQLEAMAWLGELEARARREHGPGDGIERAQADFLDKLLIPFLDRFVPTLELEISSRGGDPLFAALGGAAASLATWQAQALGAALPAPPAPALADEPLTEEQNLWG